MFQETDDGRIMNLYNVVIMNKTFETKDIRLELQSSKGELQIIGGELSAAEGAAVDGVFLIRLPKESITQHNTEEKIKVFANDKLVDEITTSFMGPVFRKN